MASECSSLFSEALLSVSARASRVVVLTGAGVSAESGVPTFRDPDGLWMKYRPQDLASFEAFMADPQRVWEWYQHRRSIIETVQPNPGHYALAEMERLFPDFILVTQNIDNLHRRAGSERVIELHGNIERNLCIACRKPWTGSDPASGEVPRCACGGLIRPDVVWFGEPLPEENLRAAWDASERCELFLSVGTSGEVYPAAHLPLVARQHGAYVVEINPRPSALARSMHERIAGPSGEILPALVLQIRRMRMTA
ncbi:MAG: NAD-dependent deacylase [Bacteroidota bacterium]|nr:NAD-dependent deacylase [Bacteroidota bacterium]